MITEHAGTCPSWCATDHTKLLIPGEPEFGTMSMCHSAETRIGMASVRANDMPEGPRVAITYGLASMTVRAEFAEWAIRLFDDLARDPEMAREIAAAVRAAASEATR